MESLAESAVARCADELGRAILYLRAYRALSSADSYHGIDFFRLSHWALHDQMFAHAMKVLGARERAGLWYLLRHYEHQMTRVPAHDALVAEIKSILPKLKLVRDKTHFHLDVTGVQDTRAVWAQADIRWKEFADALDAAFQLVCVLHTHIRGVEYSLPDYDGSDARRAAEQAYD